ncbi:NHL repeat-containing protein 2 [Chamberlinius hualienensis]
MDSLLLSNLEAAQALLEVCNDDNQSTEESNHSKLVMQHIAKFASNSNLEIPEFNEKFQWINTDRPLLLHEDLAGKIVVLDFFTYCCINCMHVLPHLEELESQFPVESGVVVIGVHSAKFDNEKVYGNVVDALSRYNVHHPVINDPEGELWSMLFIACWPTLLILSPKGRILFILVGETCKTQLFEYVRGCVNYFEENGELNHVSLPKRSISADETNLKFPGKVSVCPQNQNRIAISDTGHHRIIIASTEGKVLYCIGGKKSGFVDGDFNRARFRAPQGMAWKDDNTLFVADTENHAIRKVNLATGNVETIVGNGNQGSDYKGGLKGIEQLINSPWDVCYNSSNFENVLFIAMAGCHQIWIYAVEDATLSNGVHLLKHTCQCLVGSGVEMNRNNYYPHNASFAQPSGLCFAQLKQNSCLIVADSESSTIRNINLETYAVTGVVGGNPNPTDLFGFGDKDGLGIAAKLQHPLDVAWDNKRSVVYVADSYNHKIKVVNLESKSCTTLAIDENIKEPGGIDVSSDGTFLFVADTNNHRIILNDLESNHATEMKIVFSNDAVVTSKVDNDNPDGVKKITISKKPHIQTYLEPIKISVGGAINFEMNVSLGEKLKLNEEAPNNWQFVVKEKNEVVFGTAKKFTELNDLSKCSINLPTTPLSNASAVFELLIYFCDTDGLCHVKIAHFTADIQYQDAIMNVDRKLDFHLPLNN